MITGVLIPHDEALPIVKQEFNGLEDYQKAVEGWIEAIDLTVMQVSFFCNEESKIIGVPINRRATLLWWLCCPEMRHRDTIGGNAVLVGLPDDEGDTTSVPADVLELLFETKSYRAMFQTADDPDAFNGNAMRYTDFFEAANAALVKFDAWTAVVRCKVVAA